MTGPTLLVKLDDGTGTFPYDISQYVDLKLPLTINRGRGDELSQVQAATLTLTLTNTDGRFTVGSVTYGIAMNQKIRVTETVGATTSHRFTGFVQNWPTAWPLGSDTYSTVTITATDLFARLARTKLKSITEQEILSDAPTAYYTLGEGSSATGAGDISGNIGPSLIATGGGVQPAFGATGLNTWDGVTGCTFAGGSWLAGPFLTIAAAPGTSEIGFIRTGLPAATEVLLVAGALFIQMDTAGRIFTVVGAPSPLSYADGRPHHAAVTWASGTNTVTLYVDGVAVSTGPLGGAGGNLLTVGGTAVSAATFNGTLAHAAYWTTTALSPARVAAHANAVLNGFNTERSDQRIARLLGYAGVAVGGMALEIGFQTAVPAQSTNGAGVLDAVNAIAAAESGLAFVRGDGVVAFQNKGHRAIQIAADWTITNDDIDPSTTFGPDMQGVANDVTAKSVTGIGQVVRNAASIAQHGSYPQDLDLFVATDQEAFDAANWLVTTKSQPQSRLSNVVIDLLTQTAAFQQAGLSLELSDRLSVTGWPTQSPAGTAELVVEGSVETLSIDNWQLALNTSNWADHSAWVLDSPIYSVLGSTTRLR